MANISCSEDPELTKPFPPARPVIVNMRTHKGDVYASRGDDELGHPMNPMTNAEVKAKFRSLVPKLMAERQSRRIIDTVDPLNAETDTRNLLQMLVV